MFIRLRCRRPVVAPQSDNERWSLTARYLVEMLIQHRFQSNLLWYSAHVGIRRVKESRCRPATRGWL